MTEGCCWPDPDPAQGIIQVDDVTRLNTTVVAGVIDVRDENDVKQVLARALSEGKHVSMRGTQHSMGGHSMAQDGLVIDTKRLNTISYNTETQLVTCGVGATWADLIKHLNTYGKSPRTMQSYCSFSVGGTIAVNAHGITSDHCLAECITSFKVILWDGTQVTCSRDGDETSQRLFSLCIGGYGLFGVIMEATMKVDDNTTIEVLQMNLTAHEFPDVYRSIRRSDDVAVKLARLEVSNTENISLIVCRKSIATTTVSALEPEPREMSTTMRIMYKWLGTSMNDFRYALERSTGMAVDWKEAHDRNSLMYESAIPLAKLYDPLYRIDDTFILQEYFVPENKFKAWITGSKSIYRDLDTVAKSVVLLNTTVRYVEEDLDTFLPYSRVEGGAFAFVLYFRMRRTDEADAELRSFHERFVSLVQGLGGSFYLPYRHHYSKEDLVKCYPNVKEFFEEKMNFDPHNVFSNEWFKAYGMQFLEDHDYPVQFEGVLEAPTRQVLSVSAASELLNNVSMQRTDSYLRLTNNAWLRGQFVDLFLTKIFNIENNKQLFAIISKSVLLARARYPNFTDVDVFRLLKDTLEKDLSSPTHFVGKVFKQVKQLSQQKEELVKETISVIGKLGKVGVIQDYVSIGDPGKLIKPLRDALDMTGNCWVVHDSDADDIPQVIERGSSAAVGDFVSVDYTDFTDGLQLKSGCADLVTMNQGLHHLPLDKIPRFLSEVSRVLRPGGIFITREHDASPELIPLLDLAHSVFNAVTGVSETDEAEELRGFRPVKEWRTLIESFSDLVDSNLYEMEKGDPTLDEMMCFVKPVPEGYSLGNRAPVVTVVPTVEEASGLPPQLTSVLSQIPSSLFEFGTDRVDKLLNSGLPAFKQFLKENAKFFTTAHQTLIGGIIDRSVEPVFTMLKKLQPILRHIKVKDIQRAQTGIIPKELFFIAPALKRKVATGQASGGELLLLSFYNDIVDAFKSKEDAQNQQREEERSEAQEKQHQREQMLLQEVSRDEIRDRLAEVLVVLPDLLKSSMTSKAGLSRLQGSLFNPGDKDGDIEKTADGLAQYLDPQAWLELRDALEVVKKEKKYPHIDSMTGKKGSTGWCKAMMAILGSSKVQLASGHKSKMNWIGLGDVVSMWQLSQDTRKASMSSNGHTEIKDKEEVSIMMGGMKNGTRTVHLTKACNIPGVKHIVRAVYGYDSNHRDVTEIIKSRFHTKETVWMSGIDMETVFDRGVVSATFDTLRQLLNSDVPTLKITYFPVEPHPAELIPKVDMLRDKLYRNGVTAASNGGGGEYTWYKLTEWMQVEIIQIFGKSMVNTPWYRFPFTDFLSLYGTVLGKEVGIVKEKFGMQKALTSMAFLTSAVPGVVMTWMFAQLLALATPLKLILGDSYEEGSLHEEIVIYLPGVPSNYNKWSSIDPRIKLKRSVVDGLFILQVPTFKGLTEVVLKLSELPGDARILEISRNSCVQVAVVLSDDETQLPKIKAMTGVEVKFPYQYPTGDTSGKPLTRLSLSVAIPYLISTVRECTSCGIKVHQIFDWY